VGSGGTRRGCLPNQPARAHAGNPRSVELPAHVGQEQDLPGRQPDGSGDNVRGVFVASRPFVTDTNGASGMSLQEMLKAAMAKGTQAIICPMCMAKAGMTMDDVIEGVVKGRPDVTMKAMTADETAVISF
jgi:hypothetical protein